MLKIIAYFFVIVFFVIDLYLICKFFEYVYCANIRKQPPMVASNKKLRQMVVDQINTNYKKSKNICDLGSGFGGLARFIANNTNANVFAVENMPFSVCVSKFLDVFCDGKNKTIWNDLFKYLDESDIKFDVYVAYLGPKLTPKLLKYKHKIPVLISLDFEITGIKPKRIIDLGGGNTLYNGKKYPHRLYVYEFF